MDEDREDENGDEEEGDAEESTDESAATRAMNAAAARCWEESRDADGHAHLEAAAKLLAKAIGENPALIAPLSIARRRIRDLDRHRRPQAKGQMELFYNPEAELPIAKQERVPMKKMSQADGVQAFSVRTAAHVRESADYVVESRYWADRFKNWLPTDKTLGDLEERLHS